VERDRLSAGAEAGRFAAAHIRHRAGTDTSRLQRQSGGMDGDHTTDGPHAMHDTDDSPAQVLASVPSWVALPVGRAETGPTIAELVEAVRAAGGFVGGAALFDPRYEPEMRRFLIRALEMEGLPVPEGGDRP
jgi:hypothetical protein